jgi:hypothetical protein
VLRYSKSDDGRSFKSVVPTITYFEVYISGGVITVAPDGSPVQDIYQFKARDSSRIDLVYAIPILYYRNKKKPRLIRRPLHSKTGYPIPVPIVEPD